MTGCPERTQSRPLPTSSDGERRNRLENYPWLRMHYPSRNYPSNSVLDQNTRHLNYHCHHPLNSCSQTLPDLLRSYASSSSCCLFKSDSDVHSLGPLHTDFI